MELGEIIDDRYKILEMIGMGGVSKVYLGMDIKLNMTVAIKEIIKNFTEKIPKAILEEVNFLKVINHPSIPKIFDLLDLESSYIIIMEYTEGKNLNRIIQEKGTISEQYTIDIAKQIIDVFKYLHGKNIIYRDLKPANIMIKSNGRISLIDFGTAQFFDMSQNHDTTCLGTIGYAAPEQYGGKSDCRTDIYAFGITLYYMITGKDPYTNIITEFLLENHNLRFYYAFQFIIHKCTQRNPSDRFQNMVELERCFNNINILEKKYSRRYSIKNFFIKQKKKRKEKFLFPVPNQINTLMPKGKEMSVPLAPNLVSMPIINERLDYSSLNGETTILSANTDVLFKMPPSVFDHQTIDIFLSYCHNDEDLADIICDKLANYSYLNISRYTTNVPYKGSLRAFMNTLGEHDKVIMIISDQYLKSRACMYEVGKLINLQNFRDKIIFIVCTNFDKQYYKEPPSENIEAKIYDLHERNQYIIFWENQRKILKEDLDLIESESAKAEILEVIRDIDKIIINDIGLFMKYLADVKGMSFHEMFEHDFSELLSELKIEL